MSETIAPLALRHLEARQALSDRVGAQAATLWESIPPERLDEGWDEIAPRLEAAVTEGQRRAAAQATAYTTAALGVASGPALEPRAFAGATLEGRQVVPELYAAVTTTKSLVGRGLGVPQAFRAGFAYMATMAATMVRDAGRSADQVASISKGATRLARVVSPGACSRCAILAGVGHFTKHFERHPGCKCTSIPVMGYDDLPEGVFGSPGEYFDSLTEAEQNRVFTNAGAEAIRLGADPIQVVNSRRGMYRHKAMPNAQIARLQPRTIGYHSDGRPIQVYTTEEGRTRRGNYGRLENLRAGDLAFDDRRRTKYRRLMPESIIHMGGGDREQTIALLRRYGYLQYGR